MYSLPVQGVIHQRRPTKKWLFGPPLHFCQTSVWNTLPLFPHPPFTNVLIESRVNVRNKKIDSDVVDGRGGGMCRRTLIRTPKRKRNCVCGRPVCGRPPWFAPPPPLWTDMFDSIYRVGTRPHALCLSKIYQMNIAVQRMCSLLDHKYYTNDFNGVNIRFCFYLTVYYTSDTNI